MTALPETTISPTVNWGPQNWGTKDWRTKDWGAGNWARENWAGRALVLVAVIVTIVLAPSFGRISSAQAAEGTSAGTETEVEDSEALPDWLRRLFDPAERRASGKPIHVVIGLDLSKSNPLVDDSDFALKVADFIRTEITGLPARSKVTLRTFGVDSAAANRLGRDRVVTNATSAKDAASFFHTVIRNVPRLVDRGTIEAQNYTNILSFLINTSQVVRCGEYDTLVILATDGIEDSEFARLNNADARLPKPRRRFFAGCGRMLMLGIGQGRNSPTTTARLRREWTRWSTEAGFEGFQGLNNW